MNNNKWTLRASGRRKVVVEKFSPRVYLLDVYEEGNKDSLFAMQIMDGDVLSYRMPPGFDIGSFNRALKQLGGEPRRTVYTALERARLRGWVI